MSGQDPFQPTLEKPSDTPAIELIPAVQATRGGSAMAELAEIARQAPPRDESMVLLNIKSAAHRAGAAYFYRFPVKDKGGRTSFIEGPSIKCANDVVRYFGKVWVGARVVSESAEAWYLEGLLVDLETGAMYARPFRQRKSQSLGGKWDEDRQTDVVFQIGASKAIRTVVTNALGQFTDYAFEIARSGLLERIEGNPDKARAWLNKRAAELEIDIKRIERSVGRTIDKWLVPDMAQVYADFSAITDGFADADGLYPTQPAGKAVGPDLRKEPESDKPKPDAKPKVAAKPKATAKPKPKKKEPEPVAEQQPEPEPEPARGPDLGKPTSEFEFVD